VSIKEDLNAVKQELSTEEKFLESLIKMEGFYKRYKKPLLGLLAAIIIGVVAMVVLDYQKQQSLQKANAIYEELRLKGPNSNLQEMLKLENPSLYRAYRFQYALETNDQEALQEISQGEDFFAQLATYQIASIQQSQNGLKESSALEAPLRDLALIQEAYLLLKEGDIEAGHRKLQQIDFNSPLKRIANFLEHYRAGMPATVSAPIGAGSNTPLLEINP